MARVWSDEAKLERWLEVELAALDGWAEVGVVPAVSVAAIRAAAVAPTPARVAEIERETNHDVAAFVDAVAAELGDEGRWFHYGLTSSDVLDTALSLTIQDAGKLVLDGVAGAFAAVVRRAQQHQETICAGRTHGVHAEPTTFGLKLAGHYAEFERNLYRLMAARKEIATCAISGAVGTFAQIDPRVEKYVADKLGLAVEPVSTQVIPRDRHAAFFAALGVVAAGIERLATEVRHLQRTEVLEAEEFFEPGQKGSSAMPHKRNPVLTENLCGLARLVRSAVTPAMENVALWHERDISHSSVERGIGPDATIHLDFALHRLADVIEKLVVYPENMARNLAMLGGLHNSQRVMLALTQAGVTREDAYRLVQRNAMAVWQSPPPRPETALIDRLKTDADVTAKLDAKTLAACFDDAHHFARVDAVFDRVFG